MLTRTDTASNVNRFGQSALQLGTSPLRTDRRASGNTGFKKLAVQGLQEVQFSHATFVVADSLVLRNRQLLKPTKRYLQPYDNSAKNKLTERNEHIIPKHE